MKWLTSIAAMFILSISCASLTARELTSADGKSKVEAEIIRYSVHTRMVTLRLEDGRRLVTPASKFSDEDREHFKELAKAKALEGAIDVDFRSRPKQKSLHRDNNQQISIEKRYYENVIKIENESSFPLKGLTINYWIVYEKFDDKLDEYFDIVDGSISLDKLGAEEEKELGAKDATLVLSAISICKPDCHRCNASAQAAANIQRERVIGHKIEVLDSDGEVIVSDISSKRVQDLLEKK